MSYEDFVHEDGGATEHRQVVDAVAEKPAVLGDGDRARGGKAVTRRCSRDRGRPRPEDKIGLASADEVIE